MKNVEAAHRGLFRDLKSMPEQKAELNFSTEFSPEEYERLSLGHVSRDMDDKWNMFFEDGWLHLHRSWTGICVYQSRVERNGDSYSTVETWVNRDATQYKETNDRYDAALLFFLISNLLLGKQTPFPLPDTLPPDSPKGAFQHSVAGSGYAETVLPDDSA